ncbi:MAG: response regulator [Halobacteria archaeon]|nr:response regulator [Halobacteria archaeon]
MTEKKTVLIVEDENELADLYAKYLKDDYETLIAYNGEEALDLVNEDVDVVLLDRRMPRMSGDEVLKELEDRGIDCRVAMVTAVTPDFDIIEMGFDDYLVKPVKREDLRETIGRLLKHSTYDEKLQEYVSLTSKRAVLEIEKDRKELKDSEEYARLETRIKKLEKELDDMFQDFDVDDLTIVMQDILKER